MSEKKPEAIIVLRNLRCSFPDLFRRAVFDGEEKSYRITLLFDPNVPAEAEQLKRFRGVMGTVFKQSTLKKKPAENCLGKNSESDSPREEYGDDTWVLKANSKTRPIVVNGEGVEVIDEDKNPIYSGCRVDARVAVWAQNDKRNKRINAVIHGVKFAGDDETFDSGHIDRDAVLNDFGARAAPGDRSFDDFDEDDVGDYEDGIPF